MTPWNPSTHAWPGGPPIGAIVAAQQAEAARSAASPLLQPPPTAEQVQTARAALQANLDRREREDIWRAARRREARDVFDQIKDPLQRVILAALNCSTLTTRFGLAYERWAEVVWHMDKLAMYFPDLHSAGGPRHGIEPWTDRAVLGWFLENVRGDPTHPTLLVEYEKRFRGWQRAYLPGWRFDNGSIADDWPASDQRPRYRAMTVLQDGRVAYASSNTVTFTSTDGRDGFNAHALAQMAVLCGLQRVDETPPASMPE